MSYLAPIPASELSGNQMGEVIRFSFGVTTVADELVEVRHFADRDKKQAVWVRLRHVNRQTDYDLRMSDSASGFFLDPTDLVQVKF